MQWTHVMTSPSFVIFLATAEIDFAMNKCLLSVSYPHGSYVISITYNWLWGEIARNGIPGQSCSLQFFVSLKGPSHSMPPYIACWVIFFTLPWEPPPQVTEQGSQSFHTLSQWTVKDLNIRHQILHITNQRLAYSFRLPYFAHFKAK